MSESWADWITRVTHISEQAARLAGVRDWVSEQARRQWTWAGRVARRKDEQWSKIAMDWIPSSGT